MKNRNLIFCAVVVERVSSVGKAGKGCTGTHSVSGITSEYKAFRRLQFDHVILWTKAFPGAYKTLLGTYPIV